MKTTGALLLAAVNVAHAATCGEALAECESLCSTRGFVEKQECWGEPDSCVICLCQDGSDVTDQLPVKCSLDYCGYDCPAYEEDPKTCSPSSEFCGDWGVPCCDNPFQVCDYTTRDPQTGEGICQDLSCTEDSVDITGVPEWHYYGGYRWNLNGGYTRKASSEDGTEMGYAKYVKSVDGGDGTLYEFALYPYAAGGGNLGWTLYCESCGYLWLVWNPEFDTDVTALDQSAWIFQGNGGTQVCADPNPVGQCWHDAIDISGIQVSCGSTSLSTGSNYTQTASLM